MSINYDKVAADNIHMQWPTEDNFTPSEEIASVVSSPTKTDTHPQQVAHELANLLDGSLRHMSSTIDQVQKLPHGKIDDDILKQLTTINHAMQQMASLVHGIGTQKLDTKNTLPNSEAALQTTIYETIQLYKPLITEHEIQYDINIAPQAKLLPTGPLSIVLNNAILNSIQAIIKADIHNGYITIKVITDKQSTCIQVTDNGCGIDKKLIDPMKQFIFGITTKEDGQGIGLAFCKDVAMRLEGSIELQNVLPHGTRMTFKYRTDKI